MQANSPEAELNTSDGNPFGALDENTDNYFKSGGASEIEDVGVSTDDATNNDIGLAPKEKEEEVEQKLEPQAEKQKEKQRMVEYGALHEERERRKELQGKVDKLESTFQNFVQQVIAKSQPEQQIPSYEEDPLQHLKSRQDAINDFIANQQQDQVRQRQFVQQQQVREQNLQQLKQQCVTDTEAYMKNTPDYRDAYKYLMESRMAEYQASGYSAQQAMQLLQEDEMTIAIQAYNQEANPAERVYNLAKMRGYQAKAQESAKMTSLKKGVEASKSLGAGGGNTPSSGISLEQLSQMTPDELNEFIADDKQWKKVSKIMRHR